MELTLVVLFVLAILGFAAGELTLIGTSVPLLPSWLWLGALVTVVVLWATVGRRLHTLSSEMAYVFVGAIVLLLLSDFFQRRFLFFSGVTVGIDALLLGGILFAIFRLARRLDRVFSPLSLLIVQACLATVFLRYVGTELIFSDDHPSFFYRLVLLREHFPNVPFYNLDWNLGYLARGFVTTGALGVFLFGWPFVQFLDPSPLGHLSYTLLLVYLYLFLVPWASYWAGRLLDWSRAAAALSAIFVLGPSLAHFEWLLKYGTLGFSLSAGLVPLGLVLGGIFLSKGLSWRLTALLCIAIVGCSAWAMMPLLFLPLIAAVDGRLFTERSFRWKIFAVSLFLAIYLSCFALPFFQQFSLSEFSSKDVLPGSVEVERGERSLAEEWSREFQGSLKKFRDPLASVNPVALLFFLPGLILLPSARLRRAFALILLWSAFLAVLGPVWKPQFELRRMVIPLMVLLAFLSGGGVVWVLERLTRDRERRPLHFLQGLLSVLLLGFVGLTPLAVGSALLNRSEYHYVFAPDLLDELSDAIRDHGGAGRTFFLGFILHDLGASSHAAQEGGHVAPLAYFSGRELFASDFFHGRWSSVDPIPASYRARGEEGIEEFLDLVHATSVVTFLREWVEYCERNPRYHEVFHRGRFRLFRREAGSRSFVFRGEGEVFRVGNSALEVVPRTEEIVLRYRYYPSLQLVSEDGVLDGVHVFEEDRGGGVTRPVSYIRLQGVTPGKRYRISLNGGG